MCSCHACSYYAYSSHVVQTQAVYLPDWVLGPTIVTVNLSYADLTQVRYLI